MRRGYRPRTARGCILAMLADQLDDRRADHDAVRDARRSAAACSGVRTPKPTATGRSVAAFRRGDRVLDRGWRRLLLAGDPGDRDVVEEPARAFEHRGQARGVGGRGGEADRGDARRRAAPGRARRLPRAGYRRRSRRRRRPRRTVGEPFGAAPDHRVGIAHQHERHVGMARAEGGGDARRCRRWSCPRPRLRRFAAWIAGPSAIGSVNGMPSSITSAPPSTSASRIAAVSPSPAVTKVTSAGRAWRRRWRGGSSNAPSRR